ncbi:winged helix-turn-helix transcriptional regulator [Altererythrobacter sp. BO-6]|uniref:ArsR/SmtB family transcription factor n=1 Tax=Altererythrobacter sp. BO-6 TaxID=2604537 RepID=UPI0013E1ECBB|nr:metalloregulator ArsR/SmtB family transcription factor [Altererythrobacter sp. BO-6]QIG54560.1 winged helix-turn-helix transcriptional regulator [Altererythrobacter sp. BO-6]
MSDEATIDKLKAVAHPLRLQILEVLRAGEFNVGDIEQASGIGQPALSQQLGVLRKAGLVETRKEAKLVFYRRVEPQLDALASLIGSGRERKPALQPAARTPAPGVANFARIS